ncbi:hypothetical protein M0802_006587 [Mischocyttarus mexicanus]|nr:hypothetical protein M0802_006587 [Mischocyttarus mexicanus]
MRMGQLEEDGQINVITRSAARHLRRKRLNEARRARNQYLDEYINGVDEKINQDKEVHSDIEKNKLTKSKARRLRKKEKAKLLECCCCDTSIVSTNFLQLEPNCCIKSNQNTFDSHLNNVQHFEDFFAQSLLSLGNHKKAIGKNEDNIKCEYKYNNQDINRLQSYLTKPVNFDSEDLSDSSQIVIFSGLPKSINKEKQTHCTKNSSGIKRSYLESCNIKVVQSSDTSFPVSENSSKSNYLFIPNSIYKDHQEENKDLSLNDQTLENVVTSETCPLKYEEDNYSSLVIQEISEEPLDIERTSQDSAIQRESVEESIEESKELILPVNSTSNNLVSIKNEQSNKIMDSKASGSVKTREEIKAEREARKAAKAANKGKGKVAANISDKQNIPIRIDNSNDNTEKQRTNEVTMLKSSDAASVTENQSDNITTKDVTVNTKSEGKSKAELRAERRAIQEAQRAAKQETQKATKQETQKATKQEVQRVAKEEQVDEKLKVKNKPNMIEPKAIATTTADHPVDNTMNKLVKKMTTDDMHQVNLFKHLYHERKDALLKISEPDFSVHPAIRKLGIQYKDKIIVGSNARCLSFLVALRQVIKDFDKPLKNDFVRDLGVELQTSVSYLHAYRPLSVSMQNALRYLNGKLIFISKDIDDPKHELMNLIDTYIEEQIKLADESISITIRTKISNGNVILTYGYSSLIEKILTDAHEAGKKFRVIIVDGRPWLEGKEQLRRLTRHGIDCSYVLINALSLVMPEVSKVFLGAHALLANGAVMSRIGTAQVALMAKSCNVPVLVACETHKSCERVQTDSIVHNELGNADDLTKSIYRNSNKSLLQNWRSKKYLNLLNITYDVTPADLVTAVVTELAILPCSSVPIRNRFFCSKSSSEEKLRNVLKNLHFPSKDVDQFCNLYKEKLFKMHENRIVRNVQMCNENNIELKDAKDMHKCFLIYSQSLKHKIFFLQELGVPKINIKMIYRLGFYLERPADEFKKITNIPEEQHIMNNMINCIGENLFNMPPIEKLKESLPVKKHYNELFSYYLQYKFGPITEKPKIERGIKYKSIRLMNKLIDIYRDDIGLDLKYMKSHINIFDVCPDYARYVLDTLKDYNMFNSTIKEIAKKWYEILNYDPENTIKILSTLKKYELDGKALKHCVEILRFDNDYLNDQLNELSTTPDIRVWCKAHRILYFLIHKGKIQERLELLRKKNCIKSVNVHLITTSKNYFDRFLQDDCIYQGKSIYIEYIFCKELGSDKKYLMNIFKRHPYWNKVSFVDMDDSLRYVKEYYSIEDICRNIQIILYSRSIISKTLQTIKESDPFSKEYTPSQQLALCMYLLEKDNHFTGDGIWDIGNTNELTNDKEIELLDPNEFLDSNQSFDVSSRS